MIFLISVVLAVFLVPRAWAIPVVLLGGLCEVAEAFFLVHYSRRRKARVGAETMIGRTARVDSTPHASPTGRSGSRATSGLPAATAAPRRGTPSACRPATA